jgi:uncharacterized protein YkwD
MALTAQRKPTDIHRKLHGAHHRHSKNYLKTYSPYLPLLMAVIIGLAINNFWTSRAHVLGAATNLTANELLQDTNIDRGQHQEGALAVNPALDAAAQAKANDMVQRNYWSHTSPNGTTPWDFIKNSGYNYQSAGENLAYGFMNAGAILTGWMNSPEHRANILNSNYQDVGFGITTAQNFQGKGPTTVVVAMYGQPASANTTTLSGGNGGFASAFTTQPSRSIARIQLLTDGLAPWSFTLLAALTVIALACLVFRHALAWHRVIIKSEDFVLSHKLIDILIIAVVIAGIILTRSAGIIS